MVDLLSIPPFIEPRLAEEIARNDFLVAELIKLRDRGLLASETVETVTREKQTRRDEIERLGRFAAATKRCQSYLSFNPKLAVEWAIAARSLAPERAEAWEQEVALLHRIGQQDEAEEVARLANAEHGHTVQVPARMTPSQAFKTVESVSRKPERESSLSEARELTAKGDKARAAAIFDRLLASQPRDVNLLIPATWAYDQAGRLADSKSCCERLKELRPSEASWWSKKITELDRRIMTVSSPAVPKIETRVPEPSPSQPRVAWTNIASEFIEVHWQKVVLSLAVLLIIVSSTVGAAIILGDKLWRPEGKCLLALAYTLLFAGFGKGLVGWGAERAGRIMLLTTLFVLPVNFTLAGELPALTGGTSLGFGVLGLVALVLMTLCWRLCQILEISGGNETAITLIALGIMTAATPRGVPFFWGFAGLVGTAVLFVTAIGRLNKPLIRNEEASAGADTQYFALGLLVFNYVWSITRIGGFVLEIPWSEVTLYALPVMLGSLACLWSAEGMKSIVATARHAAILKYLGFVLSALGFALALAKPERIALYSGNTLATALIGLGIYSRALRIERKPVYLYVAFAAFFVGYFGAFDFVRDMIASLEASASQALGYPGKLPPSFRALNGLVLNLILAVLGWIFTTRWNDPKLARHCQYIGLPLSIFACALASFEPMAAILTLSGYTILYAIATWIYRTPWLGYFACAAFTGAAVAGSTYLGDLTFGAKALAASMIALGLWLVCPWLEWRGIAEEYRTPLLRSARVVSFVGLVLACLASVQPGSPNWTTTLAFTSLAILYVLIGIESPRISVAHGATGCAAMALLLAIGLASPSAGVEVTQAWLAFWSALMAVGLTLIAVPLVSYTDQRLVVYPPALRHVGLFLAGLGMFLGWGHYIDRGLDLSRVDHFETALVFGLAASAFALAHRQSPGGVRVTLAMASGTVAVVLGIGTIVGGLTVLQPYVGSIVLACVLLLICAASLRRSEGLAWLIFRRTLVGFSLVAVFLGLLSAPVAINFADSTVPLSLLLLLASLVLGAMTLLERSPGPWHASLGLGWLTVCSVATWRLSLPARQIVEIIDSRSGGIALGSAIYALSLVVIRGIAIRQARDPYYARPLRTISLGAGLVGFALVLQAQHDPHVQFLPSLLALILLASAGWGLAGIEAQPIYTYAGNIALIFAAYLTMFEAGRDRSGHVSALGVLATSLSIGFWALGQGSRRWLNEGWQRIYVQAFDVCTLIVAGLAIPFCLEAPRALGYSALPFVLMIKTFPAAEWLYLVFALAAMATWGQLKPWLTLDGRETIFLGIAFVFWALGLLTTQAKSRICRVLKLIDKAYERPMFHSAIVAGVLTIGFRIEDMGLNGQPWFMKPWIYLGLGLLSLGMFKPYGRRGWIDGFVALFSVGTAAIAGPRLISIERLLLVPPTLAIGWWILSRLLKSVEPEVYRLLALRDVSISQRVYEWSRVFAWSAGVPVCCLVLTLAFNDVYELELFLPKDPIVGWWAVLTTLGLVLLYLRLALQLSDRLVLGIQGLILAVLLWFGVHGSPIAPWITSQLFMPIMTSFFAIGSCWLSLRLMRGHTRMIPVVGHRFAPELATELGRENAWAGVGLIGLALAFTRLATTPTTTITFLLTALATALLMVGNRRRDFAQLAAILWTGAWIYAAFDASQRLSFLVGSAHLESVALGLAAASVTLVILTGRFRRHGPELGVGVEWVTLGNSGLAVLAVLVSRVLNQPWAGPGVGILVAIAVVWILVAERWSSVPLAYAGQVALYTAYATYRSAYPLPISSDATMMLLLGVVELGLAEVLQRIGKPLFARPALAAALVLPAVAIGFSLQDGLTSERSLFLSFAVASFYALLGLRHRSKVLGYAAATLYNAFLWIIWSRIGWRLSDDPQLYFVPVSLSAILFAEANQKELGKQTVAAIRGVGLMVIYLALAVPIWQTESLLAWVFALLISMVAIFAGIGLRAPTFLWLGLAGFGLTVIYQLGQLSFDYPIAKWAIMLGLGLALILFVAFNEKKALSLSVRKYLNQVREWD